MTQETPDLWKALLVEFLGTFTLVFVGASAAAITVAQGGSLLTVALAFGLALMAIIYIWGTYSGAHVNPAVSFGFAVAGQMNWGLMIGYWIAQILGAIAAAALVAYFFGTTNGAGASVGTLTWTDAGKAIFVEAVITFFLVLAYLFIYRNPMQALVAGIVIGSVLAIGTISGYYLTGGSTNPARSFGSAIFSSNLGSIWIYIVGPLLGALVAALVYKLFTTDFNCCYKLDECKKRVTDDCGRCIKICKRPCVDKCGKPILDECCKQIYEEYEVIEQHHGYIQENYDHQMRMWMNEYKLDHKGNCAPCGLPMAKKVIDKVIVEETVVVSTPTWSPPVVTPVMSTPYMSAPVVTPVMSTPYDVTPVTSNEIRSTRVVSPTGFRTPVTSTPYSIPRI